MNCADGLHRWADAFSRGRFTGEPSRPCQVPGCHYVTLDPLHDVNTWREGDGYHAACACGWADGPYPSETDAVDASNVHPVAS